MKREKIPKSLKVEIKKDYQRCRYCKTTYNLTIDHKVPVIKGGSSKKQNLQVLCGFCNLRKSDMTHKQVLMMFQWFKKIQKGRLKYGAKDTNLR